MNNVYDCLIIGAGPSGIGAGIKLHQAGIKVAVIEKSTPGGKINVAPRVDNYPGQTKIPGPDLAVVFFERLMNAGVEFIGDEITSLDKENDLFVLKGLSTTYYSKTVYIATGTVERKIGLPLEDELFGHGLSYCAICDGHFFKGEDVLVIGGGNSALKEAIYLSGLVKHLYLIHRRNEFRGYPKIVEELKNKENVTILTPYIPLEFLMKDGKLCGVKIQNKETQEERILEVQGVFPLVGQDPNSKFINLDIKNEWGNIPVDKKMMTRVSGAFSGGDVLPRDIRQIYLAEHDGMVAANSILEYLGK
ncbi:MAG: FAD-dependent oxidoreductase [Bacilli bacterium]|nr:FAD-dependent oxidoreductase [Bacilli bacterium]